MTTLIPKPRLYRALFSFLAALALSFFV